MRSDRFVLEAEMSGAHDPEKKEPGEPSPAEEEERDLSDDERGEVSGGATDDTVYDPYRPPDSREDAPEGFDGA